MKANQKFVEADEGVSPVIGVILMVAITVVLAAVVFVLVSDLGGNTNAATFPNVQATDAGSYFITLDHRGGECIDLADYTITVNGGSKIAAFYPGSATSGTQKSGEWCVGEEITFASGLTAAGSAAIKAVDNDGKAVVYEKTIALA